MSCPRLTSNPGSCKGTLRQMLYSGSHSLFFFIESKYIAGMHPIGSIKFSNRNIFLTLKPLGFFSQYSTGGVFHPPPPPLCKIRSKHPRELKLTGLIAYIMFYEICKFESSSIINDVIVTKLPKQWQNSDLRETEQIIYHSKGIDESYLKMYFLLNLSHCVKRYQFWPFYNARSPNMVMSRDPRGKF